MKIIAIFDSGDKIIDRYTVIIENDDLENINNETNIHDYLGLSEGGEAYSQWGQAHYLRGESNRHIGKQIDFTDLSEETQMHIAKRIFGENE